jgi:hypothetical protein
VTNHLPSPEFPRHQILLPQTNTGEASLAQPQFTVQRLAVPATSNAGETPVVQPQFTVQRLTLPAASNAGEVPTHCHTKCVKNGINFGLCMLGLAQPQPPYALRAAIPNGRSRDSRPQGVITTYHMTLSCV